MRQTCLNTVYDIAKKNNKIVFIGSDLGPGVLDQFKSKFPDRFFMEGVAEQGIIGMSAGLALQGYKPYVNTISTFITRRCFEQVLVDLCLHNLDVTLIGNGGGLVYAPLGPTHQCTEDLSIMRTLPNIKVFAPCDANDMKHIVLETQKTKGPKYIRIARGGEKNVTGTKATKIGKSLVLIPKLRNVFITTGVMAQIAIKASQILKKKYKINVGVIQFTTIKPLDTLFLKRNIKKMINIVTVEENFIDGGFGSSLNEWIINNNHSKNLNIRNIGIANKFIDKYGSQDELLRYTGLTEINLVKQMLNLLK